MTHSRLIMEKYLCPFQQLPLVLLDIIARRAINDFVLQMFQQEISKETKWCVLVGVFFAQLPYKMNNVNYW
jgi:hypothetical protein